LFDAVLARDMVTFADAEGAPLDIETFREWR
jgi:hypothetical protein